MDIATKQQRVVDDEVAVQALRQLRIKKDQRGKTLRELVAGIPIARSTLSRVMQYPEDCTVSIYRAIARKFGLPEYVPGRKLSISERQGVINFPELQSPLPHSAKTNELTAQPEYDIRELVGMPLVINLKTIANVVNKDFREVVYRAVSKYVSECSAILSYAENEGCVE